MAIRLDIRDADFERRFAELLDMKREVSEDVDRAVAEIIADVRARGDDALYDLTAKFDRVDLRPTGLRVTPQEIEIGRAHV